MERRGGKRREGERKGGGRGIRTPLRIGLVTGLRVLRPGVLLELSSNKQYGYIARDTRI